MLYKNVVFLDIDGVINSTYYFEKTQFKSEFDKENLIQLSKLFSKYNCCCVLASTWKIATNNVPEYELKQYNELKDILLKYNIKISDQTPGNGINKPLEIYEWLCNNKCSNFVIIDDDHTYAEYAVYGLDKYLVKTNLHGKTREDAGFMQKHLTKAIKILKKE